MSMYQIDMTITTCFVLIAELLLSVAKLYLDISPFYPQIGYFTIDVRSARIK